MVDHSAVLVADRLTHLHPPSAEPGEANLVADPGAGFLYGALQVDAPMGGNGPGRIPQRDEVARRVARLALERGGAVLHQLTGKRIGRSLPLASPESGLAGGLRPRRRCRLWSRLQPSQLRRARDIAIDGEPALGGCLPHETFKLLGAFYTQGRPALCLGQLDQRGGHQDRGILGAEGFATGREGEPVRGLAMVEAVAGAHEVPANEIG